MMPRRVLTEEDRIKMQRLWYAGANLRLIGERFRVAPKTVRIVLEKQGVHVPRNKRVEF